MCIIQNHVRWGIFQRFPVKMCFRRIMYSNIDLIFNLIENELKLIWFMWCKIWRDLFVHQAQIHIIRENYNVQLLL